MAESFVTKGGPEEFLRGALEKIVFFECRVAQLSAELAAERAAVLREKEVIASLRAREVELEMLLTQARSSVTTMKSRIVELEERVRLLEAEREQFLAGFVEKAQVASASGGIDSESPPEQTDLAALSGFIAEMREKIEQLKMWKSAAQKAGITIDEGRTFQTSGSVTTVSNLADRFEKAGRLSLLPAGSEQKKELFTTRTETSLYERSMDELSAADPDRRRRAAECLRALCSRAAAPSIIAALEREGDPAVKVALLNALATTGESSYASQAICEIADEHPEVRVAALDAAAALAKVHAEPALIGALSDSSPLVRRRAVLLLSFITTPAAVHALTTMVSDGDPGVARIAAQALSGRPELQAQSALTRALNHQETSVRRCAADAVSRWFGEAVDPDASPVQRRRTARRIADKLARLDEGALRKAVMKVPPLSPAAQQPSGPVQKPQTQSSTPVVSQPQKTKSVESVIVEKAPEPVKKVPLPENKPSAFEASLIAEIRTSLRGRTAEELSQFTSSELADVMDSLSILLKRGILSQRGPRFFMS